MPASAARSQENLTSCAVNGVPKAAVIRIRNFATPHQAGVQTPNFISHGFHISNTTVTSTNWAGYAATGSTYTSVSTTYTQPSVSCSGPRGANTTGGAGRSPYCATRSAVPRPTSAQGGTMPDSASPLVNKFVTAINTGDKPGLYALLADGERAQA